MKPQRRLPLLGAAAAVAAAACVGALLVISGVVSVGASSGHWPMMDWFLHFAARRSVATQSLRIEVPRLDDPALAALGGVHYRLQCQNCHGAPGAPAELTYRGMTPPPPDLRAQIALWKPRELYWIVQHGIKYTAMPAWPTQRRDDEAWALVAFLQQLPRLDAAGYAALSGRSTPGDGGAPALRLHDCAACHGAAGEGRGMAPRLAGQSAAYLEASLDAYASGERHSGFMQPLAAALDAPLRAALAGHYAALDAGAPEAGAGRRDAAAQRGARIAQEGLPRQGLPACAACHGTEGRGGVHPRYPQLAGQPREYLLLQLQLFQSGRRGGTRYAHLMQTVAQRLSAQQMEDLAAYYAAK